MREWLSGRASPCQGESRGFDPRLPLPSQSIVATSPSGKARLCKSCTSGSNPLVASQIKRDPENHAFLLYRILSMRQQHSYSIEAIILKRTDLGEADRI
jgi:recombinational DNA repair protein (RecF pathway)